MYIIFQAVSGFQCTVKPYKLDSLGTKVNVKFRGDSGLMGFIYTGLNRLRTTGHVGIEGISVYRESIIEGKVC